MEKDFFKEAKYYALTARLKRISDYMLYSAKDLYKSLDLDIDPNWHLIFLLFKEQETLTMSEIAEAFQISQVAVIKIINKMKKKDYLITTKDKNDSRKQLLQLSPKALEQLPKLEKVWQAGKKSIVDMTDNEEHLFAQLTHLEESIRESNFKERTLKYLKNG